jgi:hypothetical protein
MCASQTSKIAQCRLTIRFEKEPLDATLSVIAETLDLDFGKKEKFTGSTETVVSRNYHIYPAL